VALSDDASTAAVLDSAGRLIEVDLNSVRKSLERPTTTN